jgi:heme oxygenase
MNNRHTGRKALRSMQFPPPERFPVRLHYGATPRRFRPELPTTGIWMLCAAIKTEETLRACLREACAESHRRLDERLGSLDMRRTHDYRTFLETSATALLPLESALVAAHVERLFPDWERRSRSRAILADIARLGGIVRPSPPPDELDFGGVLGTMYVLEGSRLGARMLLRQVAQSRHPEVLEARAYLGHGAGSNLWQSFLTALEFHGARLSDDRGVVRAALRAFDRFAAAPSSVGHASPERVGDGV